MGALPLRAIPFGRPRKRCHLKRGVVRDVETPIGTQAVERRVLEISINRREQVGDLFGTRVVRCQPPVFQPAL